MIVIKIAFLTPCKAVRSLRYRNVLDMEELETEALLMGEQKKVGQ